MAKKEKFWDEVSARHKAYYNKLSDEVQEDYDRHPFENDRQYQSFKKKNDKARTKKTEEKEGIEKEIVVDTYD
ncbi:MAG: hypothetical protein ACREAE_07505 [Nitrosopumilaceae archaeon]